MPAALLERAAGILGEAETAMLLTGRGPEQQSQGVDNVLAFINLMLALGHSGKAFSGYACMTGQGNGQGGREHGQKADQLPGYRKLDNAAHRAEIAAIWNIAPEELPRPGLSAAELLNAVGASIHCLLVVASNIVVSAPDATRLVDRLKSVGTLIVADIFLSETAELAGVVLPVTQWAEEEGTMTNLEGRVILRQRAKEPPKEVWSDLQILKAIADRLGRGQYFSDGNREVFEEFRRASAGGTADYAGITYDRIVAQDGVFWPCPSVDRPDTPRLFLDRFGTDDGKARFHAVEHRPSAEMPDQEFPYFLTTGRVLAQYQSGTQTRRIADLNAADPDPFVEIHPDTARGLHIADGDLVVVETRRGRIVIKARLTRDIRLDTVFVPFHWGAAGSANALTLAALDPVSKIPEFKVCAVRLEKAATPASTRSEATIATYLN